MNAPITQRTWAHDEVSPFRAHLLCQFGNRCQKSATSSREKLRKKSDRALPFAKLRRFRADLGENRSRRNRLAPNSLLFDNREFDHREQGNSILEQAILLGLSEKLCRATSPRHWLPPSPIPEKGRILDELCVRLASR